MEQPRPAELEEVIERKYEWDQELEPTGHREANQPPEQPASANTPTDEQPEHILPVEEISELKSRWEMLQLKFVDNPHQSVEQANELVSNLLSRLAEVHAERAASLEGRSSNGGVSTEDLRITLQSYRSEFDHLIEI